MSKEEYRQLSVIVAGGLNTDITALGLTQLVGDDLYGKELKIGPGGKSRNIAHMIATLTGPNTVAMISRTSRDPFGLWKLPYEALQSVQVNTDYIKIVDFEESGKFPGIALIGVDTHGNRNAYAILGIINDFSPEDIDEATPIFEAIQKNNGLIALSLELPFRTAIHAIEKAQEHNIQILVDPGGINNTDKDELLNQHLYLLKPNEHEAKTLTGIAVTNMETAKKAAQKIMQKDIENVLITHGENGAYLFTPTAALHIPVPDLPDSEEKDSTGCGDQTMATLCAALTFGKDLEIAAKEAVIAGTLQFRKHGVQPVTKEEISKYSV